MDLAGWQRELEGVHARLGQCFARPEPRRRALSYLQGLLGPVERKNGWQLAEQVGDRRPDGMQRLLRDAHWDADAVLRELRGYVADRFGLKGGALVVDETSFPKKGDKSAGVKRQYCGSLGKVENCQVGVFLYYAAASGGGAFVDRELYLPEDWLADRERCREAGIPDDRSFATKPAQARAMLRRARDAGFRPAWTLGDSVYGSDPELRAELEAWGWNYVLAVRRTEPLRPASEDGLVTRTAEQLAEAAGDWRRLSAGDGAKGPRLYDWALVPLVHLTATTGSHALLVRRSLDPSGERAYFLVFNTAATTLPEMVRAAGLRWTVEVGFEQAKGEVGLGHYEVRVMHGWYRHVTLALVAHAVLAALARPAAAIKKGAKPSSP